MTGLLEAPEAEASGTKAEVDAAPRRAGWSRLRVELRLARRQALRAWPVSLLVMALVAMPMALLAGAGTFLASRTASPEQTATVELGLAQAWLEIASGADPLLTQASPAEPYLILPQDGDGRPISSELPPLESPASLLPSGTTTIKIGSGAVSVDTPGGIGTLNTVVGEAWSPSLVGAFEFIDGRAPENDREALVSPGALARLEAEIGDTVALRDPAASLTIVGVMKQADRADIEQTVFLPSPFDTGVERWRWYAPEWQPTIDDLRELNHQGVVSYARNLALDPRYASTRDLGSGPLWVIVAGAATIGTFCAYLVVLLAGAAFSVSARRQERSLAVAASVGAPRSSVFRIVLLQGTVLGVVGGVIGATAGVALAYPALTLFDDGSAGSFWGFNIPWLGVAGVTLFAILVGTLAALMPARAATRGDVLSALRGARKPISVRANRPRWGSLLMALGLIATVLGGIAIGVLNDIMDYDNPLRTWATIGVISGPILFQIGVVLAGHWVLSLLARAGSRIGLASRIASRDAAAHPSRVVPAFGAIAACVFIAAFALGSVGMGMGANQRTWYYQSPLGSARAEIYVPSYADAAGAEDRAVRALRDAGASAIAVVRGQNQTYETNPDGTPLEELAQTIFMPALQEYVDCNDIDEGECTTADGALLSAGNVYVVDAVQLDTTLGIAVPSEARAAFADGYALVTKSDASAPYHSVGPQFVADGAVTINEWDRAWLDQHWQNYDPSAPPPTPLSRVAIPAVIVDVPHELRWQIIISPQTASELGIPLVPLTTVAEFSTPPSQQARDHLALVAQQPWSDAGSFNISFEDGPPPAAPWLWLILGAAGVLVLGAGAVTLGLARVERRPDDATLSAVGGTRGLRRRIAFWQGVIIVGVGSITGTLAGIIPLWGVVLMSRQAVRFADAPWPWLTLLALGLPLVIALANWLVPPRHPDLTRRTAIA